jgi:DNA ligase-associated metallophosphoesterase
MAEALRRKEDGALPADAGPDSVALAGVALVGILGVVVEACPAGALWWADERLLVVADLHFEKGSSFARRGRMLPPYDTAETLARLSALVDRLRPRAVVALGDSFHDGEAAARLSPDHRAAIARLMAGREWVWIAGNHDPDRPAGLGGMVADTLAVGPLTFRHAPTAPDAAGTAPGGSPASSAGSSLRSSSSGFPRSSPGGFHGEIAGHLHPSARVYGRGKSVRRRCFAGDGLRLILPAFGAYAGGLDVTDRAFAGLFAPETFRAFVLGDERVYAVGRRALRPA